MVAKAEVLRLKRRLSVLIAAEGVTPAKPRELTILESRKVQTPQTVSDQAKPAHAEKQAVRTLLIVRAKHKEQLRQGRRPNDQQVLWEMFPDHHQAEIVAHHQDQQNLLAEAIDQLHPLRLFKSRNQAKAADRQQKSAPHPEVVVRVLLRKANRKPARKGMPRKGR